MAQQGSFVLSNGMYCVYGTSEEGICVDVYADDTRTHLISMQHGICVYNSESDPEILQMLMESMVHEF